MGKIMKEGKQYGVGGISDASDIAYGSGTVESALDCLSLESFKVIGIATGNNAGGFKITHSANTTFVMLYIDTFGRHTLIRKTSNSVATSTVITGATYLSTSFTSTETKLKVNPYTRAGFFIISGQMSDIAISTYTE